MDTRHEHLQGFRYRATKSGSVLLYWKEKLVKTLSGYEAARFLDKITQAGPDDTGMIMAKATGNFKRGNERPFPSNCQKE